MSEIYIVRQNGKDGRIWAPGNCVDVEFTLCVLPNGTLVYKRVVPLEYPVELDVQEDFFEETPPKHVEETPAPEQEPVEEKAGPDWSKLFVRTNG